MKPLIGITPDTHDGKKLRTRTRSEKIIYLWDSYLKAIMDHGGVPVILPVTRNKRLIKEIADRFHGFLLAGGNFDVPPDYYGEKPKKWLGKLKPARSFFERELLLAAAERDKPLLGICGGFQIINVAFGGSLYQDLQKERPASEDHQQEVPRNKPWHPVEVRPGTRLHHILAGNSSSRPFKTRVNSTHHQAVKELGEGLSATAFAQDGVVEALESEHHFFILGVQWHPELLYHSQKEQAEIFKAFIHAAREKADIKQSE